MKTYKVEDNVPLPVGKHGIYGVLPSLRETFSKMNHGESFIFDGVATLVYRAAPPGFKAITRRMPDGKVRVWLVKKPESKPNEKTEPRRNPKAGH